MADELVGQWKNLKLTEEEDEDVIDDISISEDGDEGQKPWLVGKLYTRKPFNKQALINTMKNIWRLVKGGELCPNQYLFTKSLVWVRVYEFPVGTRSAAMAKTIGARIGDLVAIDETLDADDCEDESAPAIIESGDYPYGPWLWASPLKKKSEVIGSEAFKQYGKKLESSGRRWADLISGKRVSRALFIGDRSEKGVDQRGARSAEEGSADDRAKNAELNFQKGDLHSEIVGDNLAGISEREKARFKTNLKVNEEKEKRSRDFATKNLQLVAKETSDGLSGCGGGTWAGKRRMKDVAQMVNGPRLILDPKDVNCEAFNGNKMMGGSMGRVAISEGGFNFQAQRQELDAEVSSVHRQKTSRRKRIIPRRQENVAGKKSDEALSLGKRLSQVVMESLEDLGYSGVPFTWRHGDLSERLDRCVVSEIWSENFPHANLSHLISSIFDHDPILLNTEKRELQNKNRKRRHGRKYFETAWCKEAQFGDHMAADWMNNSGVSLLDRIERVREELWGCFGKKEPRIS
ncbi:hypothetical protein COLO4_36224 [Corchorus olitorius]|uniref:DUF4283 domain-containing protein n=1 Tax=Corchorus olitorius TaxID=93759 RepID=A0A1R3GAC1_9ROSI|nr:hypothetical protein COLO4_36224 [Corchorus olitorius]